MKTLLALMTVSAVAALQAVTVSWNLPNSDADAGWVSEIGSIYFVYSETAVTDYASMYTNTSGATAASGYTKSTSASFDTAAEVGGTAAAANGYFSDTKLDGVTTGFYYVFVVNKNDPAQWAVAGGKSYVAGGTNGIYKDNVAGGSAGSIPEAGEYIDLEAFLGGTWAAPQAPEPTALALLALGVAGLALRRRVK